MMKMMIMKKNYIVPTMAMSAFAPVSILMSSGESGRSVNTNVGLTGGSNSGDVLKAY